MNGVIVSRNLKPIPNKFVQSLFGKKAYEGLDGELIVGEPWDKDCFRNTSSGVMSVEGRPEVRLFAFDSIKHPVMMFKERLGLSTEQASRFVWPVMHTMIYSERDLRKQEELFLEKGYEGVMLRHPDGLYKFGRSTLKSGWLMKLKRFEDSEAVVLGVVEKMRNDNEATVDNLGHKKRSSHKANKHGACTMGALSVRDIYNGVEFEIGTGFDDKIRENIWSLKDTYGTHIGKVIKYKFFPTGSKDRPRFPVFLGFRDEIDL